MTGPEHYREAERLLSNASHLKNRIGEVVVAAEHALKLAQVHATLALAAATALNGDRSDFVDFKAWDAVAGVHRDGGDS